MIAFPRMLVSAASAAGIKVPSNPDEFDSDTNRNEHPHFFVFCIAQLGRPILHGMPSHWSNAKIIAAIPNEQIMKVSLQNLFELGFV